MATDFFERQAVAKRRTGLLIIYLCLAVLSIAFVVSATIQFSLAANSPELANDPALWFVVTLCVISVVGCGSLYKILILAGGGKVIAEELGGRLINPNTGNFAEKRLLNVVEEMAIASGVTVPDVYLLEDQSINAFAAGFSPKNAVIGVTRGCMNLLNRDEIQGVIGHEFSHILNGDMRLNIRLIGIVHGILMLAIIGRTVMRSTSNRNNKNGGIFLVGLVILLVGYIGVFFGNLIKAAVSRQREFLADASAVQFTRNPSGLAGALKKIGGLISGSTIDHPKAEVASHMYFAQGISLSSLFATHPPLEERIKQLDPYFNGQFSKVDSNHIPEDVEPSVFRVSPERSVFSAVAPVNPGVMADRVGKVSVDNVSFASNLISSIPDGLAKHLRTPEGAQAVVLLCFLDLETKLRDQQLALIKERLSAEVARVVNVIAVSASHIAPVKLPLIQLSIPALRGISPSEYEVFRELVSRMVVMDGAVTMSEFVLSVLLFQTLDRVHLKVSQSKWNAKSISDLGNAVESIFSNLLIKEVRLSWKDVKHLKSLLRVSKSPVP